MSSENDGANCELTICDGDYYEDHNLERQACTAAQIGTNKALYMSYLVEDFVEVVHVEDEYIHGSADLFEHLFHSLALQNGQKEPTICLFVLAVDKDMTRKIVYDTLDEFPALNVAVVDPANDYFTGHVNLWIRMQGSEPFLHPREKYAQLKAPKDRTPGGGCADEVASEPQLLTANKTAASIALHMVVALLQNGTLQEEVKFDLKKFRVDPIGEWIWSEEAQKEQAKLKEEVTP